MPRGYQLLKLEDFSGGLNLRDAPSEVGDNEASECLNVTCDERGGIVKRLGLTKYNAVELNSSAIQYLFFSDALSLLIAQQGDKLYTSDGAGTWSASIKTFSTSARCAAVDFLGKVIIVHPDDGCFSYDGASFSGAIANAPKGKCITSWQNAIWTAGDPANKSRLTRSDPGAITWPASPVTVDIRDRDDREITALAFSQGLDTQGRPGLLVFKNSSVHRVNNSTSGAYTTLSTDAGASSPMAVASLLGLTAFFNRRGIYLTDGLGPPTVVSEKIEPLFTPQQLNYASHGNWVAGAYRDRFVFALQSSLAAHNDILLEFHPMVGWIVPHSIEVSAMTTWSHNDSKLYTCSPTSGFAFETFKGWSDDGVDISAKWQSRWFEPGAGYQLRMRRLLISGRGTYSLFVKPDYTTGGGLVCPVNIVGSGSGIWDESIWNEAFWGPNSYEDYQQFFSLGHARSVAFRLQETSSTSATAPSLNGNGASPEVGSFALYGLHLDWVPLTPS